MVWHNASYLGMIRLRFSAGTVPEPGFRGRDLSILAIYCVKLFDLMRQSRKIEVEHMAWEAQYLNYIDKLGYENFLTAMM